MITMQGIKSHQIPLVWPKVLPYIRMGLDYSEDLELDEVRKKLLATEAQLWVIRDGNTLKSVLVTELTPPVIRFLLLGGADADEWIDHLVDVAGQFGASHGCTHIEVVGREGWRRTGRRLGFNHIYTVYRKEIDNGQ